MQRVVGIRFKRAGKIYYFDPGDWEIQPGDRVIVETSRGVEHGEAVVGPKEVTDEEVVSPLKEVMRIATPEDKQLIAENDDKAKRAFHVGMEKIDKHKLPMKLVEVEYTFDGSKIIFYYTAPGRVDFRQLVKDLASVFRTRIELRQIGVRDEAKMLGGLGPCGRSLCCATFLGDFDPVSIRMAKEQSLSLNPSKISGICGRLMCCLRYERDMYRQARKSMPEIGDRIQAQGEEVRIVDRDLLGEQVVVENSHGDRQKMTMVELMAPKPEAKPDPNPIPVPEAEEETEETSEEQARKKKRRLRSRRKRKPAGEPGTEA